MTPSKKTPKKVPAPAKPKLAVPSVGRGAKRAKAKSGRQKQHVRSTIPDREWKILLLKSDNQCAFPGCTQRLIAPGGPEAPDGLEPVGEIAHIVADSRQGPRGDFDLRDEDRNKEPNLVLMCSKDHKIVDSPHFARVYTVQVMRQIKLDHESRVERDRAARAAARAPTTPSSPYPRETVFSTLLPVVAFPQYVWSATSGHTKLTSELFSKIDNAKISGGDLAPFVLRDRFYAFHDLSDTNGPFAALIDIGTAERHELTDFWTTPEYRTIFVDLLNRALMRHLDRQNVRYDRRHKRYYFMAASSGRERVEQYEALTRKSRRKVVWQPRAKKTNVPHGFWWHLAASLKFHQMEPKQWCLAIRPERHLTRDGSVPLTAREIGRRVTKLKARMFNDLYFGEVNFWRYFLARGGSRITLKVGDQQVLLYSRLIDFDVDSPGIPGDVKAYTTAPPDETEALFEVENDDGGAEDEGWEQYDGDLNAADTVEDGPSGDDDEANDDAAA